MPQAIILREHHPGIVGLRYQVQQLAEVLAVRQSCGVLYCDDSAFDCAHRTIHVGDEGPVARDRALEVGQEGRRFRSELSVLRMPAHHRALGRRSPLLADGLDAGDEVREALLACDLGGDEGVQLREAGRATAVPARLLLQRPSLLGRQRLPGRGERAETPGPHGHAVRERRRLPGRGAARQLPQHLVSRPGAPALPEQRARALRDVGGRERLPARRARPASGGHMANGAGGRGRSAAAAPVSHRRAADALVDGPM
mmetsp:Transcript_76435/g.216104  ORF Transcript_76435/g.216104 Transcript_76435/m.216104 type:complete len:256 (+) Transcript_76435:820-1587(+)